MLAEFSELGIKMEAEVWPEKQTFQMIQYQHQQPVLLSFHLKSRWRPQLLKTDQS